MHPDERQQNAYLHADNLDAPQPHVIVAIDKGNYNKQFITVTGDYGDLLNRFRGGSNRAKKEGSLLSCVGGVWKLTHVPFPYVDLPRL